MPVSARVVGDERMAARRVLAACDVAAERHRAAALDCTHHLQLVEAHMAAVGLATKSFFREYGPAHGCRCYLVAEAWWLARNGLRLCREEAEFGNPCGGP